MGQSTSRTNTDFYPPDTSVFIPVTQPGDLGLDPRSGQQQTNNFKHPMAALFHVVFKFLAFFLYLFGGLFGQDFISVFVAVILLISMDFWVVKNVTGRLLAGLRWSNYIDDKGNSHWVFENKNAANNQQDSRDSMSGFREELRGARGSADASVFWTGLFLSSFLWIILMLVSIFRLNIQWFMLVTLASVLSVSNLYGYIRCRLGTSDIRSSVTQYVAKQVFFNFFTGGSSNKATA